MRFRWNHPQELSQEGASLRKLQSMGGLSKENLQNAQESHNSIDAALRL